MSSIFDKMKKNARMAKNFNVAKKATPSQRIDNKEFPGEDGEYIVVLSGFNDFEANEVSYTEFVFTAADVEGQEDVAGKKLNIFTKWEETDWSTLEDIQEEFFGTCQLLGIDTPNCETVTEIKDGIDSLVSSRTMVRVRLVTNKKGYRNVNVKGSYETTDPEEVEDVVEAPEGGEDEWEEETSETPEVETSEESYEYAPSEYIGYPCLYDGVQYTCCGADDEAGTIDIEDEEGNEYGPISFGEVEWVE